MQYITTFSSLSSLWFSFKLVFFCCCCCCYCCCFLSGCLYCFPCSCLKHLVVFVVLWYLLFCFVPFMVTTLEGRLTSIYPNPNLALANVLLYFLAQPFLIHYLVKSNKLYHSPLLKILSKLILFIAPNL